MKNKAYTNKNLIIISVVAIIVAISIALGFTLAYFSDRKEIDGQATIGVFNLELYTNSGTTKYQQNAYTLALPSTINQSVTIDLQIKNTGTISGIARVNVSVVLKDSPENVVLYQDVNFTNTNFINSSNQFSQANIVSLYFFSYYTSVLEANNSVNFISTLTLKNQNLAGKEVIVQVLLAEAIPYAGNESLLGQYWSQELVENINKK